MRWPTCWRGITGCWATQAIHAAVKLGVVDALADLDRQVAEHGAGLGALGALDADVLDHERVEAVCDARDQRRDDERCETQCASRTQRRVPGRAAVRTVERSH